VVDEVFDEKAAEVLKLKKGTVVVMMHSGSRGLGHQICTDATQECERQMQPQGIEVRPMCP
jgi:tRNA-splicing ligase RtcB